MCIFRQVFFFFFVIEIKITSFSDSELKCVVTMHAVPDFSVYFYLSFALITTGKLGSNLNAAFSYE